MTRKVILTGVMIFFRPGSVQQLLVGGMIAGLYMTAAVAIRPFESRFNNNFKICTDAAVMVTFNIAVMLNDKVDMSKEFLSEFSLNFSLILVNIVLPCLVVVEQLYRNRSRAHGDLNVEQKKLGSEFNNPLGEDTVEETSCRQMVPSRTSKLVSQSNGAVSETVSKIDSRNSIFRMYKQRSFS